MNETLVNRYDREPSAKIAPPRESLINRWDREPEPQAQLLPPETDEERTKRQRAYMPFIIGWGTSEQEKHLRDMAVDAVGEDFVREYERSDQFNRDFMLGMLLQKDTMLQGESDTDYLVRMSDANQKSIAESYGSVADVWADAREKLLPIMHERYTRMREIEADITDYVLGRELGGENGLDAARMAETLAEIDPEKREKIQSARNFAVQYLAPLKKRVQDGGFLSASMILKDLDALDEEVFNFIGDDPEKAQMLVQQLSAFAGDMQKSMQEAGLVTVPDEFVTAIGKKLANMSHLGQSYPEILIRNKSGNVSRVIDANRMDEITYNEVAEAERSEDYAVEHYASREDRLASARGHLRNAVNESTKITGSYWNPTNWLRTASSMFGDTALYLTPGGMITGTAEMVTGGMQEIYNRYRASGYNDEEATNQALIEAPIEAAVELLPFGVGGVWLSKMVKASVKSGKPGTFARKIARLTQTKPLTAMGAEFGLGVLEEGVFEPTAQGVMQWTAEQTMDALGVPHAQSTPFKECFNELAELTNPNHVAGLIIFTAGLVGSRYRTFKKNAEFYQANRDLIGLTGLSEESIDELLSTPDAQKEEKSAQLYKEEWEKDPEGMKQRILERNAAYTANGDALSLAGLQQGQVEGESNAQKIFRRGWQERVRAGILPSVEEAADGKIRITQTDAAGNVILDSTMSPEAADVFLQQALDKADTEEYARRLETLGVRRTESMPTPDIRAELAQEAAVEGGEAIAEEIEKTSERTGIRIEDLTEGLPSELAEPIRRRGYITKEDAQKISDMAQGQVAALEAGGMTHGKARMSYFKEVGKGRTLGEWASFAEHFANIERAANIEEGAGLASVFSTRRAKIIDGKVVFEHALYAVRTGADAYSLLEDTTERVISQAVEARARNLVETGKYATYQEAEAAAWDELGMQTARARTEVLKHDKEADIPEVDREKPESIIEALSTMATSSFIGSQYIPAWMTDMANMMKGNVSFVADMLKLRDAINAAIEHNPNLGDFTTLLESIGLGVQSVFGNARLKATEDIDKSNANALEKANGERTGDYVPSAEEITSEGQKNEDDIREHEREQQEEIEKEYPEDTAAEQEKQRDMFEQTTNKANAPAGMQGVFEGDSCLYNDAEGFYAGYIDKSKLKDGTPQVKQGAKGKHGIIQGKELTGRFQQTAAPLYVWRRKNGELWLISGRHRFELLMRDEGVQSHMCYVFNEDAQHDERWARLMDYENNMRDDQADELTAAIYARETGYDDKRLRELGLMRNKSRSKRGIRIGREARKDLWELFKSGGISAQDAEQICMMTEYISDEAKAEEIQARAVYMLEHDKSWEDIAGMAQVVAFAKNRRLKQGTLMFGEDWAATQERMAKYLSLSISRIRNNIKIIEQGKRNAGRNRKEAERLGIFTTTQQDSALKMRELQELLAQYEHAGLHPEIMADAEMWDGETEVDPIAKWLRTREEKHQQEEEEKELTQEEYLEKQAGMDDMFGGATFAIRSKKQWQIRGEETIWQILDRRPESVRLRNVKKELQKLMQQLEIAGGGKAGRLGTGAQSLGQLIALVSATRANLPEKYKVRGLNAIMTWATFYADMVQRGEATPDALIPKGAYFETVVKRVRAFAEKQEKRLLSEEEIREAVAGLVGKKIDKLMMNAAEQCVAKINQFEKDRAREAIETIWKAAQPKREPGKHDRSAKMNADALRLLNRAHELMSYKGEELEGQITELTQRLTQLDKLTNSEETAEERATLEEEIGLARTFLGWEKMDVQAAQQAAVAFEEMARTGRAAWQDELQDRRAATQYTMQKIRREKKWVKGGAAKSDVAAQRAKKDSSLAGVAYGFMSMAQKMRALAPYMGKEFTYSQMRRISSMNLEMRIRSNELSEWLFTTLSQITGKKKELELRDWLMKQNELHETDIVVEKPRKREITLTLEEAERWAAMTLEEAAEERTRLKAEADAKKRAIDTPSDGQIAQMVQELARIRKAKAFAERWNAADEAGKNAIREELAAQTNAATAAEANKAVSQYIRTSLAAAKRTKIRAAEEYKEKQRLTMSKMGALQALLIMEQPWYTGVEEANGITPEIKDQLKAFVGSDVLRFGYAMREKLAEARGELAATAERITGIPFPSQENYFPAGGGVFFHSGSASKVAEKLTSGGLPGLPPMLIPRSATAPELSWSVSAVDQFVAAMQAQNNFIITADFIQEWKSLFLDRDFNLEMERNLGQDVCNALKQDLRIWANAATADAVACLAAKNMMGRFLSRYAVIQLGGNLSTILKNLIGAGANAPAVNKGVELIKGADQKTVVAVAEKTLNRLRLLAGMRGIVGKKAAFSWEEIKSHPMIRSRFQAHGAAISRAAREGAKDTGKSGKGAAGRAAEAYTQGLMEAIEWADVSGNTLTAYAMANAVYDQISEQDKGNTLTEQQRKELAIGAVMNMLDQGAQPLAATQKGTLVVSTGTFGWLSNLLFLFKSEALAKVGYWASEVMHAKNQGTAKAWLAASWNVSSSMAIMGGSMAVIATVFRWLYGKLFGPDDDSAGDKAEKIASSLIKETAMSLAGDVPLLSDAIAFGVGRLFGERQYTAHAGTNTPIINMIYHGEAVYKLHTRKKKPTKAEYVSAYVGMLKGAALSLAAGQGGTGYNALSEIVTAAAASGNFVNAAAKTIWRKDEAQKKKK